MTLIRVEGKDAGADLLPAITKGLAILRITDAPLHIIGAVDEFDVSNMDLHNPDDDIHVKLACPAEIFCGGEVVGGAVHMHGTFSVSGLAPIHGHVWSAVVRTNHVNVWVLATHRPGGDLR